MATCLMIERGAIRVADDYFQRGRVVPGPPGWSHFDDRGIATEPKYEFVWPLGDIVTALVRSGLEIERLEEFPTSEQQRWRYGDALEACGGTAGLVRAPCEEAMTSPAARPSEEDLRVASSGADCANQPSRPPALLQPAASRVPPRGRRRDLAEAVGLC